MGDLNALFSWTTRDSTEWLNLAKRLKLSADVMWKNYSDALNEYPLSQDVWNRRLAFMESYMMLAGFTFENLLKGIDIGRNSNPEDDSGLDTNLWAVHGRLWNVNGGHGISDFAKRIDENLTADEIELLKRLEEFIVWAGRYPIPKTANKFSNSNEPKNLTTLKDTDPEIINRLFKHFSEILTIEANISNLQ